MRSLLNRGKIGIVAVAVLMAAMSGYAAPTVTVLTDKESYRAGETIELSLGGENHDEPLSIDVYVGLIGRYGALFTLGAGGWGAYLEPWMADLFVPNHFYMAPVAFQWFAIPCAMPPIAEVGQYSFAAGLTQPGTLDFVCEVSFAPFTINPPELHVHVSAETGDDASDGSQDRPFKTITHALASVNGSEAQPVTIHVAAGTYAKWTNGETFPLNMKSWVSLSGIGAEDTILDAESGAKHVICCGEVEGVVIGGLTITGGQADWKWPCNGGGGICCYDSSTKIENSIITRNSAYGPVWDEGSVYGGGIYCSRGSTIIENCTISDNSIYDCNSSDGCYVYGGGMCSAGGSLLMQNNVICGNYGHGPWFSANGGGICCLGDSGTIQKNTIADNKVGEYSDGGGIYGWGSVVIEANTIVGNSSDRHGGGICCFSSVTVRDNTILNNYAESDGAGIWCTGSPTIKGNTIQDNYSSYEGAGICCEFNSTAQICDNVISENSSGIFSSDSSPDISYNAIAENKDGGISCWFGGNPSVTNNAVCYNGTHGINIGEGPSAEIRCNTIVGNAKFGIDCYGWDYETIVDCIIWGNGNDLSGCRATYSCIKDDDAGEGNIHSDPMFVEGPFGDCYLDVQSPCIDAGSRSVAEAGLSDRTTQEDGTRDTGVVDIGRHYRIPIGERPSAWIELISPNPAVQGVDWIQFIGSATDSDGTVEGYEWQSDLDGLLAASAAFTLDARSLTPGTHRIRFRAKDDEGLWSRSSFATLNVFPYPTRHVFVNGISGDDSNDGSEDAPFKTMTHALAIVSGTESDPGTISVEAGTYASSTNGETFPLNMKPWISLEGESAQTTTLDAEKRAYHVIHCVDVHNSTIQGFFITGGRADGSAAYGDDRGAGISCETSSLAILENEISGNGALNGGGISCKDSSPTIGNNTISDNVLYTPYGPWYACQGGGIYCEGGSPLIEGNIIAEHDTLYGGGICCWDSCLPTISNNEIRDNEASSGGAIYCYESAPTIENNLITGNTSGTGAGGAVYCEWNLYSYQTEISNNTIVDNAGGLHCQPSPRLRVIDCILWGNGVNLAWCSATYCCIEDPTEGEGNIHDDPMFVAGPLGEFYLNPDSPCIDAGSQSAEAAGLADRTTQADGTPDTGTVDMGCHYPIP